MEAKRKDTAEALSTQNYSEKKAQPRVVVLPVR
jgi:hypothetical protein